MQELRIDPLSGLRVLVGPPSPDAAPAEAAEAGDDPLAGGRGQPALFASRPGAGTVEEIASLPAARTLLDLGADGLATTMALWRERLRAHLDAPFRHLAVDEGHPDAGDSSRARLHVLGFVPAAVARERERFTAYHERTQGRNLLEDLLVEEVRAGERIVAVDRDAIALCPFAGAAPFHIQVVPRRPAARFEDDGPLGATALWEALRRLAAVHDGESPPLALWLRTAPSGAESFCWRIDVLPRLAPPDSLPLGAGVWANPVAPERAAELLRAA